GNIATGRLGTDGNFTGLTTGGGLSSGWTRVVATGGELLFYRAQTGDIATGKLGTDGHFTALAISTLTNGWTDVVATDQATIRVMTYNMYVGTYFQALANVHTPSDVPNAIKQIYDEIVASEPAARAKAVARQITAESPDLVGLQEAYILRRSERPPEPGVP